MSKTPRDTARHLARQQFELSGPIEAAIEDLPRQTTRGIALWVASGKAAGDDIEGALTAGRWTLGGAQRAYAAEYRRLCRR
jgi:hypothetical protein